VNISPLWVKFDSLHALENTANAIGTNMFEGFEPSKELIQLYVHWKNNVISELELISSLHRLYGV
jgi:putative transcriptional regulator